ncbi:hypothetical protein Droror1_Dr00022926 [Drosera rotundifolia]
MAGFEGKWVKLDQSGTGPGARSSHAISIVGRKVYAFGGEFTPRVPVDNNLYVYDLDDQSWSLANAEGEIPPPRIGVTMAAINGIIYVFGGRDATRKELNELYSYDTTTSKWSLLSSGDGGAPHRSYHSVAADGRYFYIFGGCGVIGQLNACGIAGRLNDLWAYDVEDKKWIQFPGPGENCKGRGGPGLAVTNGKVWVVYGFTGEEVDDIHFFDLVKKEWFEVETTGDKPTARSVFSTASIGKYIYIFGGEVDPSDLGHLGSGKFAGDVYALDTERLVWKKVQESWKQTDHPGPRGWSAFARGELNGQTGLLVYGGNSPSNDRLDDIFFFTPSLEIPVE